MVSWLGKIQPAAAEARARRATERESARKQAERTELDPAAPERAKLKAAFAAAATHLARLERDNRATFERLNDVTREAREALARHDAIEPRQGRLGSATKHRAWSDAREALERALEQASTAAIRHRRRELDDSKRNEVLARNAALREHSNAPRTLELYERVRAGEQAHARSVRLEARRAGQSDAREVLATERELQEVTRALTRNAGFLRTLDRSARQHVPDDPRPARARRARAAATAPRHPSKVPPTSHPASVA